MLLDNLEELFENSSSSSESERSKPPQVSPDPPLDNNSEALDVEKVCEALDKSEGAESIEIAVRIRPQTKLVVSMGLPIMSAPVIHKHDEDQHQQEGEQHQK